MTKKITDKNVSLVEEKLTCTRNLVAATAALVRGRNQFPSNGQSALQPEHAAPSKLFAEIRWTATNGVNGQSRRYRKIVLDQAHCAHRTFFVRRSQTGGLFFRRQHRASYLAHSVGQSFVNPLRWRWSDPKPRSALHS